MAKRISVEEFDGIQPNCFYLASCSGGIVADGFCFYAQMHLESDGDNYYLYIVPEDHSAEDPAWAEEYEKALKYADEWGCIVSDDLQEINEYVYDELEHCNTRYAFEKDEYGYICGNCF